MFKAVGKINCSSSWWLVINVENEICNYYRSILNIYSRRIKLCHPLHGAHVTILAGKYEQPVNKEIWWKFHNKEIEIEYSNDIQTDNIYYWLPVKCKEAENIRIELGLTPTIKWPWHLTIGYNPDSI